MILVLTNKEDLTADFVIVEAKRQGVPILRVNREDFPEAASILVDYRSQGVSAVICTPAGQAKLSDVRAIWYRRPGLPGPDARLRQTSEPAEAVFIRREVDDFLSGVWRLSNAHWVSPPARVWEAELKAYQLEVARAVGFRIPATRITASKRAALEFIEGVKGETVVKPVRGGMTTTKNGAWMLVTSPITTERLHEMPESLPVPYIFQERVTKAADVRVTVIGRTMFPISIIPEGVDNVPIDWRLIEEARLRYKPIVLPHETERAVITLLDRLGLEFGAIDLVQTDDGFVFLEINPSGQWAWLELQTGLPMARTLVRLLGGHEGEHSVA